VDPRQSRHHASRYAPHREGFVAFFAAFFFARVLFTGALSYHQRGRSVCTNKADVPMVEADDIVIEALLDEVLDAPMIEDAVDEALGILTGERTFDRLPGIETEIRRVNEERDRLVDAVKAGGTLSALVAALSAQEVRLTELQAQAAAARLERRVEVLDDAKVRRELLELARGWRKVLATDPSHARPIIATLLDGRVTITPTGRPKEWDLQGTRTLTGLFSGQIFTMSFLSWG